MQLSFNDRDVYNARFIGRKPNNGVQRTALRTAADAERCMAIQVIYKTIIVIIGKKYSCKIKRIYLKSIMNIYYDKFEYGFATEFLVLSGATPDSCVRSKI